MNKYKALICVTLILALIGVCFAFSTLATSGSWADYAESDAWYKNYTDAPTYEISSAARLASLAKLVNAGNSFEGKIIDIKENIDLGDHYWVPIGNDANPFEGTVIGNLNTISGMHINALNGACAGLFGNVQGPGEVANLAVTGSINVSESGNIGGAVGLASNGAKITAVSTDVSTYGYYDEMVSFMRAFLPGAMKDNNHVKMGVMTGVLRVAKEGILSGLNNLGVYTVFDEKFSDAFGFTEAEVEEMARYYGREDKMPEIKSWYDGYDFGGCEVYNPWSVLYYFDNYCKPQPYWLDTSSNDIINELVETLPFDMVETLESLMKGESAVVPMTRELGPYQYIRDREDTLYALIVSTGYLKPVGDIVDGSCEVKLPNRELETVFNSDVLRKLRRNASGGRSLRAVENAFFRRSPVEFKDK